MKIIKKVNGYMVLLRLILPVLISLMLWMTTDIKHEISEIRQTAVNVAVETMKYNINHLEHHRQFEVVVCERLIAIETLVKNGK